MHMFYIPNVVIYLKETPFEILLNQVNIFDEFEFVMHAFIGFNLQKIKWRLGKGNLLLVIDFNHNLCKSVPEALSGIF